MQSTETEMTDRWRQLMRADEDVFHKFASAAGDLAVNLVVAAIILAITFWAAGWASNLVRGLIARVHRQGPPDTTLQSFGGSLARYVVVIVGLVAVLSQLGVQTTSILAVLGAASLAIGLALQGTLGNVAAGTMLLLLRPYRVGDVVELGGRTGTVQSLDLFVTELSTPDNVKVVLPNGKVFGDTIVNFSFHDTRRVDAVFKAPVAMDIRPILDALEHRALDNPRVLAEPPVQVEVTGMSELYVEAAVHAWVRRPDYVTVKTDLMLAARLLIQGAELPPLPPPASPPKPRRGRKGAELEGG
jgi:small conductance mechanosensitive channel